MSAFVPALAAMPRAISLGLLLSLAAAAAPVHAEGQGQGLERLNSVQLRGYFDGLRQLERRRLDQKLSQLGQLEACLQRPAAGAASACLQQAHQQRRQDRRQWQAEMTALRQRYNLPTEPERGRGGPERRGQPPQGA